MIDLPQIRYVRLGTGDLAAAVTLLRSLKGKYTVLLEHGMDAVFALADRITELDYGRPVACGTPGEIRRTPASGWCPKGGRSSPTRRALTADVRHRPRADDPLQAAGAASSG